MSKVMLVEDDNNLREIYGERLLAEGYEIVSAGDGEEALSLAIKEKPDLIVADVMMPKISGFDMLDILRQTPETKNTKVVMMTALSQTEDKARADKLGANKYLVKSQVTLEDVVRVVHDLLNDSGPAEIKDDPDEPAVASDSTAPPIMPTAQPVANTNTAATAPVPTEDVKPSGSVNINVKEEPDIPIASPPASPIASASSDTDTASATSTSDAVSNVNQQIDDFANTTDKTEVKQVPVTKNIQPPITQDTAEPASARKKIIEPIEGLPETPDINELYQKELASEEAAAKLTANPNAGSTIGAPTQNPNPISSEAPEAAAQPLEATDNSQISGLTLDDTQPTPPPNPDDKPKSGPNLDQIAL
jgi:CheY-like chemotaxis protein